MAITRINHFQAKAGHEEQLFVFLKNVITIVRSCPGSISCQLVRSIEDSAQLVIIEEWENVEAHQKASAAIPPEQLQQAMTMFAKPPVGQYYRR